MTGQATNSLLGRANEKIVRVLTLFAVCALALMMFLMFADVLLRYIFNSPIQGAQELIEFLMAILIPFSIVYCARLKTHIVVDFIVEGFSERTRKRIDCFNGFLMVVLFVPISRQSYLFVFEELESGLTSPVLYIPVYPFVGMVALAFFALMLVLIEQFVSSLKEIFA